jgi:hypothetical protein
MPIVRTGCEPQSSRLLNQRGAAGICRSVWNAQLSSWRASTRGGSTPCLRCAETTDPSLNRPIRATSGLRSATFLKVCRVPSPTSYVGLRDHGPGPLRTGSHNALTTRAVPCARAAASSHGQRLHLVVDSTGLSIVGEGEWAAAKHGGRVKRGWKKLHLGVDRSGNIIAHALTDATVNEALTGIALIEGITVRWPVSPRTPPTTRSPSATSPPHVVRESLCRRPRPPRPRDGARARGRASGRLG